METKKNPCIAIVPTPSLSHFLPLIDFSKRLVISHPHFHFIFFIPSYGPPSSEILSIYQSHLPQTEFIILQPIKSKEPSMLPRIQRTVTLSLPSLRDELSSSISSRTHLHFVAMVTHLFSVDALEVAKELNLKSYVLHSSSVTSLSFFLHFPELDEDHDLVSTGFLELSQPLKLPGCVGFQGKDLPELVHERSSDSYRTVLHFSKRLRLADGIIVNSFLDLEREAITALQQSNHKFPPVYHVGPILKIGENPAHPECLKWLDNQPQNSVLYVCFGTMGSLSKDQLHLLALGLEMSGHKFLWVVKSPPDNFPKGFLERTKDQGLVVSSWAPQIEILKHESTGGFLTHCGWKSTLETMVYGKPVIVWPLFAEQSMNAVMLTEQFKVAVRLKGDENKNGIAMIEEVARVVRVLMESDEGKELGRRIQVFKEAAVKALSEGGSSTRMLSNIAQEWTNLSAK